MANNLIHREITDIDRGRQMVYLITLFSVLYIHEIEFIIN